MRRRGRAGSALSQDGAKYRGPQPGFAEQDPANWYASAKSAIRDAMYEAGATPEDVKAIE